MGLNMSNLDRAIRILLSIVAIALIQQQIISGIFATLVVGIVIVVITTTIFGICPLYNWFGINTMKKKNSMSK